MAASKWRSETGTEVCQQLNTMKYRRFSDKLFDNGITETKLAYTVFFLIIIDSQEMLPNAFFLKYLFYRPNYTFLARCKPQIQSS